MKYFKDQDSRVFAFESDGSQDNVIQDGLYPITETEADELRRPKITNIYIWERIKSERDRRKSCGVMVTTSDGDKWFHTDTDSRIQQLGLKDRARDLLASGGVMSDVVMIRGQQVEWKTMDGTFVSLTAQLAFDIVKAVGDMDDIQHAIAEAHKMAMEVSTDPSSYDYSTGWQETYADMI